MNRLLSAIIIAIFFTSAVSGCGNNNLKIDNTDKYIFNQDSQENFIRYQSQLYYAESEDSYYYLNTDNGFLYVIDKKNAQVSAALRKKRLPARQGNIACEKNKNVRLF